MSLYGDIGSLAVGAVGSLAVGAVGSLAVGAVWVAVGVIGSPITVGAAVGTVVKTAIGTVTITTPTKAKEIVTSPDEIRNRILFLLCQLHRLNVSGPASGLLAREEVCQEGRESLLDLLDHLRGQRGLQLLQLLLQ